MGEVFRSDRVFGGWAKQAQISQVLLPELSLFFCLDLNGWLRPQRVLSCTSSRSKAESTTGLTTKMVRKIGFPATHPILHQFSML